MKKFRIIWLIFTVTIVLVFGAYRINEIRITDSSGPKITCAADMLTVSIEDGEDVLLQGVTAVDKKDGDVTKSVIVEKISNFFDGGKRTVTYAAFDSDNHIAKLERDITYTDYHSPKFSLTGPLRFRTGEALRLNEIVRAKDCLDGDLSNKVKLQMDSDINNRTPGRYAIEYSVTNSAGDVAYLPVSIEVYQADSWDAKLVLSEYLLYYNGSEPDYKSLLRCLKVGNTEYPFEGVEVPKPEEVPGEEAPEITVLPKSSVEIISQVNTKVPGVYPVYLTYRGERYNATEMVYVVVEEQ